MLVINQQILDDICQHALQTYPDECCGILVGSDQGNERTVVQAYRARNVSEQRRNDRYIIDEKKLIEVMKSVRNSPFDIVGFYHSHPDSASAPSRYDSEHAAWPGYTYLIVSVEKERVVSVQAWVMPEENETFIEQPLHAKEYADS